MSPLPHLSFVAFVVLIFRHLPICVGLSSRVDLGFATMVFIIVVCSSDLIFSVLIWSLGALIFCIVVYGIDLVCVAMVFGALIFHVVVCQGDLVHVHLVFTVVIYISTRI
jgi:hypothetical protein